ncbi:hypothetical protein ACP70R_010363 [Stipagrostis hirtigluma subsp. patula]
MENNESHFSCICAETTSMAASKSSWTMHTANFLESPHNVDEMDPEASSGSSFSYGSPSFSDSFDNDDSFITSELMREEEDDDESLQDTACSSAARRKAMYFVDVGSQQQVSKADQQAMSSYSNNECNELRKKGLCLLPISMLINYLG